MYKVDIMSQAYANRVLFSQYFKTYEEALDWVEHTRYFRNHDCIITEYDADEEGES